MKKKKCVGFWDLDFDLLAHSSPFDYTLYVRLRWLMDERTRLLGAHDNLISLEKICEEMWRWKDYETKKVKLIPSISKIKKALNRLEEKTLIKILKGKQLDSRFLGVQKDALVIYFPWAAPDAEIFDEQYNNK